MKKVILLLIFMAVHNVAQNVVVLEDKAITNLKEGKFFFPAASPDGNYILFSSITYKGLWSKNITSGKISKITNANGAGYEPGFSTFANEIIFREDKFIQGKRISSINSYDLVSKKTNVIEEGIRDLKICRDNVNAFTNYVKENEIQLMPKQKMVQKTTLNEKTVFIQDTKIVLTDNGSSRLFLPMGEGNYIWPSLSPDKTKLLFTFAGKGTFVSSLTGTILKHIGYANYPSWSPDGNWIVFMKDIDDGEKIISSDVYIANINTGKYFNLTSGKNDIELYPKWGKDISEIFYNTNNGQIRKIKLQFEK